MSETQKGFQSESLVEKYHSLERKEMRAQYLDGS